MSKRPARPANTPWMMAYLTVRDSDKAMDFYEKAFGFTRGIALPGPNGKTGHAEMHWKDARIMFSPEGFNGCPAKCPTTSGQVSPMNLYFYVEDVDAAFKRAVAAGAQVVGQLTDMFWGDSIAAVKDPDGYIWSMATNVAECDFSKMPK